MEASQLAETCFLAETVKIIHKIKAKSASASLLCVTVFSETVTRLM